MKKNILFISFAFLILYNVNAQSLVPVSSTIEHKEKVRPCLLVKLDPDPETLKNAWIDYLKKEYDFKLKGMGWFSNKDLLYSEEVIIQKLSSKKMDLYTNVVEDGNGSEMKVFASFGYDIYLNEEEYPIEYKAMNEMIVSFLKQYLPKYYNTEINASAKSVKNLNKKIKSLNADIKKNNRDIENLNEEIEEYKKSSKDNSSKLKAAEVKLKDRQDKLESTTNKLQKL